MLTDKTVLSHKKRERDYRVRDGGGLYLFVTTEEVRSWRYKYRFGGKEKLLAIGRPADGLRHRASAQQPWRVGTRRVHEPLPPGHMDIKADSPAA
jgi:hypothetical protein